jgi:enamidase
MASTRIDNLGRVVTGDLESPVSDAESVHIEDGRIVEVESTTTTAETVIDANGLTLTPGFVDAHTHPLLGGFTPRQNALGWCENYLHGGVTSMVSAGECHVPGRPTDAAGLRALAVLAKGSYDRHRPGGVKVNAGTLLLSDDMTEADIEDARLSGIERMKILFALEDVDHARKLVQWGRDRGLVSLMHCGGSSLPGTKNITAAMFEQIEPDIAAHFNGGPTPLPDDGIDRLIEETEMVLELIVGGNQAVAVDVLRRARDRGELSRLQIGTDTPTGTGVIPCGMLLEMSILAGLTTVPAPEIVALATGNVARHHRLDTGLVEAGRPADLCLLGAPMGSQASDAMGALEHGEYAAVDKVLVDGELLVDRSRNTPPAKRSAVVH